MRDLLSPGRLQNRFDSASSSLACAQGITNVVMCDQVSTRRLLARHKQLVIRCEPWTSKLYLLLNSLLLPHQLLLLVNHFDRAGRIRLPTPIMTDLLVYSTFSPSPAASRKARRQPC